MQSLRGPRTQRTGLILFAAILTVVVAGCSGGSDTPITRFLLPLQPNQEPAQPASTATGTASIFLNSTIPANATEMTVSVAPNGIALANISLAHIHVPDPNGLDPNGPAILYLFERSVEGTFPAIGVTKIFTPAALTADNFHPASGVNTWADL